PEYFSGNDPSWLHPFLAQCYLHFAERPWEFCMGDDKNQFILLYLRDEAARLFPIANGSQEFPWYGNNFSILIMELCNIFSPWDSIREVEDKLRRLRMKYCDRISPFLLKFDALTSMLEWNDSVLSHALYSALPHRITREMDFDTFPSTFEGVKAIVRRIDNQYW
ncbi:hypothetical protein B0H14DRAFT_2181511, partial [Mycena olivaceomarginata]